MADSKLTVDLTGPIEWCFDFEHVENKPISLDEWYLGDVFGELQGSILSVFGKTFDEFFRRESPFSFHIPQIAAFCKEPASPLDILIQFGFDEDRDQHHYTHSIDKLVAIEFDSRRNPYGTPSIGEPYVYRMDVRTLNRLKKFSAALRELADNMDTELDKVVIEEEQTHD
jgi:hypothetical protein